MGDRFLAVWALRLRTWLHKATSAHGIDVPPAQTPKQTTLMKVPPPADHTAQALLMLDMLDSSARASGSGGREDRGRTLGGA